MSEDFDSSSWKTAAREAAEVATTIWDNLGVDGRKRHRTIFSGISTKAKKKWTRCSSRANKALLQLGDEDTHLTKNNLCRLMFALDLFAKKFANNKPYRLLVRFDDTFLKTVVDFRKSLETGHDDIKLHEFFVNLKNILTKIHDAVVFNTRAFDKYANIARKIFALDALAEIVAFARIAGTRAISRRAKRKQLEEEEERKWEENEKEKEEARLPRSRRARMVSKLKRAWSTLSSSSGSRRRARITRGDYDFGSYGTESYNAPRNAPITPPDFNDAVLRTVNTDISDIGFDARNDTRDMVPDAYDFSNLREPELAPPSAPSSVTDDPVVAAKGDNAPDSPNRLDIIGSNISWDENDLKWAELDKHLKLCDRMIEGDVPDQAYEKYEKRKKELFEKTPVDKIDYRFRTIIDFAPVMYFYFLGSKNFQRVPGLYQLSAAPSARAAQINPLYRWFSTNDGNVPKESSAIEAYTQTFLLETLGAASSIFVSLFRSFLVPGWEGADHKLLALQDLATGVAIMDFCIEHSDFDFRNNIMNYTNARKSIQMEYEKYYTKFKDKAINHTAWGNFVREHENEVKNRMTPKAFMCFMRCIISISFLLDSDVGGDDFFNDFRVCEAVSLLMPFKWNKIMLFRTQNFSEVGKTPKLYRDEFTGQGDVENKPGGDENAQGSVDNERIPPHFLYVRYTNSIQEFSSVILSNTREFSTKLALLLGELGNPSKNRPPTTETDKKND